MPNRIITIAVLSLFFFTTLCLGAFFYVTHYPWVDFSQLEHYNPSKPSILYDDQGIEWARFQLDRRDVIALENIPKHVINAFVSAEDHNFFKHAGLSFKGIIRSFFVNILRFRRAQGASTITQQLARLLFFDAQKSFKRKLKEQLLSLIIEQQFSKEQILQTYLNHIYLGAGIYGVEAACQRFWGISVKDISIDKAASLAAIVQSPSRLCPLNNPELNLIRRNYILKSMANLGYITKNELLEATKAPITVKEDLSQHAPHLKETIRLFLEETIGKEKLYAGGLKIQTTLNLKYQKAAESVFNEQIKKLKATITPDMQGGFVAINGSTGAIKAIIGGYDYAHSQFNRALKAKRQLGSIFKPLIYAQALIAGKQLTDIEVDEPLTLNVNNQQWSPQNSYKYFEGPMTLARALVLSGNIISIKIYLALDPQKIISLASACGLSGTIQPYPALALGCTDHTPIEAVAMINVFAQNGVYIKPYFIEWIKDEWGTKLYKYKEEKRRVMHPFIAQQINKVLTATVERYKKRYPKTWFTFDALGKTGTTNDARTCWFAGATPELTSIAYIGCDDNRQLGKTVYASQTALPIWREFNKLIGSTKPHFEYNPIFTNQCINGKTGKLCDKNDLEAIELLQFT